jgi:cyclopropane fatty-acyl-phospholipid synthase-like methyltransferase
MQPDPRDKVYRDLIDRQLVEDDAKMRASAERILKTLFEFVAPQSLLDVGCGVGSWLKSAQQLGISDIRGLEGSWLDRSKVVVDPSLVETRDLEQGFSLGRQFDLVVCLEVAEHLSPDSAPRLVDSLIAHGDLVLFSAAIPYQGGHHHLNEQFPDYWAGLFSSHGYRPVDLIRPRLWTDETVWYWLRQNAILYAHQSVLDANEKLRREFEEIRPLDLVHPFYYLVRMNEVKKITEQHNAMIEVLKTGGVFEVTPLPDGKVRITKR